MHICHLPSEIYIDFLQNPSPELLVDGTENIFDCKCRKWRMIIEVENQPVSILPYINTTVA